MLFFFLFYAFFLYFFFFFQAEDGIRDHCVTGVQTCALPIYLPRRLYERVPRVRQQVDEDLLELNGVPHHDRMPRAHVQLDLDLAEPKLLLRSEERRVGKECISRWVAEY